MNVDSEPEIIFKWTNLCRLCLSSDSHIDLFSSDLNSQDCVSKIRSCLNLLVYYGDPMPTKLCSKCHLKLDEWYKFRKECIQSEANVKKRLQPYKDIQFVKEYFERCAKFESSEIVSSSSKSNTNSVHNFDEVNSSVPSQEYGDDIVSYDEKRTFSKSFIKKFGSAALKDFIFNDGKSDVKIFPKQSARKKLRRSNVSLAPEQEQNTENNSAKKEWVKNEGSVLGTIVSVTGSASDIWDPHCQKQTEDSGLYYNTSENVNKSDEKAKSDQYDNSIDKTCPDCGCEFETEEQFELHTCCLIESSTNFEQEDGHFEDSISLGSEYDGTESFSAEDQYASDLADRPLTQVKITPWKCLQCKLYFMSRLELRRHYSSVSCLSKKTRSLECEFCYRQFLSFNDLLEHQIVHIKVKLELTEDDLICCNQCSLQFPDEGRYKKHLLIHSLKRKITIRRYKCSSCSQKFISKSAYESHLLSHSQMQNTSETMPEAVEVDVLPPTESSTTTIPAEAASQEEPRKSGGAIRCFRCGQMFASVTQLEHHETIKHKNPTPYTCRKCGLRFSARSQLLMHLRVHMSKSSAKTNEANEQPNSCTICEARFLLEADLESHMKTHRLPPSEPPSPPPPQGPEESEYSNEMFAKYKCSLCSRLYVRANSCIRHGQQSHKGEKVVPLKLKRSVFLGRRTSLPPGGKVKHKCPRCPKYFFSFNAFSVHAYRTHGLKMSNPSEDTNILETEEKPASPKPEETESKCPFCNKDIKPSYISLHIKKFHRGQVIDPAIGKDIPTDSCVCRYCLKTCSTPHNRKLHESIHYPMKAQQNQCETCGQKFAETSLYDDHVRTCKSIRCGKCQKIFFKFINLTQHSCTGKKSDEAHKCTVCLSAFTSLDLLQIHIKNFHGKKPEPTSPQPGTSKNSGKRLERELWREESNKIVCMVGEKFYCTYCDCEFTTMQESNEHRAAHPRGNWYAVQISDSLFQCTICDKFFETRKSSLLHINYHKKSLMPEQPKGLQLSFEPEVEILTPDIKPPETPKSRKIYCRYCNAGFRDEEDLQDHLFHTHVNQT